MFTKNDVAAVIAYNKTANMFYFSNSTKVKRVNWYIRNMDVTYLNSVLSKPLHYIEDFEQLKKQVRAELVATGQL